MKQGGQRACPFGTINKGMTVNNSGKLSLEQYNNLNAMLTTVGKNAIMAQKEKGMTVEWSVDRTNAIVAHTLCALLSELGCLPTTIEIDGHVMDGAKGLRFIMTHHEKGEEGRFPGWLLQSSTQQKKSIQMGIYPAPEKKAGDKEDKKEQEVKSLADKYSSFE